MAASDDMKKDLWASWANTAAGSVNDEVDLDDEDEVRDHVDKMVDLATAFADAMLEEFEDRFEPNGTGAKRRKRKKKDPDDEDPED